jgi:hypothetical protein
MNKKSICKGEYFDMSNINDNEFVDPLDAIVKKHQEAAGITPPIIEDPKPVNNTNEALGNIDVDDDQYGDNDLAKEIAAEEAKEQKELEEKRQAAMDAQKPEIMMPPQSLDPEFQKESIEFQGKNLEIVSNMIEQVTTKHNITTGGIPLEKRPLVMGDLMELYYRDGEVITDEFEKVILDNWMEDPSGNTTATPQDTQNEPVKETTTISNEGPATINIDVKPDQPVTVNIDESITHVLSSANVVNVRVREVTEDEIKRTTIIENSQQPGIIQSYDTGMNDTPVTLPMSGYRTVIRPINWFESLAMAAPTSRNQADFQMRKWSIIYSHMKNNSIGNFKDFDDFMHKTKYADGELLAWAVLVATADETEELAVTCGNPKCRKQFIHKYQPRTIVHLDPKKIPKNYDEVHQVSPGPAAVELFNKISGKRTRYELPHTRIIVEFNEPSAFDHIQYKLPAIRELYRRYRPDDPEMENYGRDSANDPMMLEFNYKMACMTQISAMTIRKDDKEYRYTNWEDIEKIISEALDVYDSSILINLIGKVQTSASPAEFYISDLKCPHCGRVEERLDIDDIAQNLLFQISRRLEAMEINLTELDSN